MKFTNGISWYDGATAMLPRLLLLLLLSVWLPKPAQANSLDFNELYSSFGVLGYEFSEKVTALEGKKVTIRGFMAPPLKAEANFFVLTERPMAICPFCSTDADWPADIVVIYLKRKQTFVQYNQQIAVDGVLEYGSWRDDETGFVSQLRLRDARFYNL